MVGRYQHVSEYGSYIDHPHDRWLSNRDQDHNRQDYISTIRGFHKKVKIVVGEANGKLFNRQDLGLALRQGLEKHAQADVTFVFHKDDDQNKACDDFRRENGIIAQLKQDFPDKFHLYWAPRRPRQHYSIVDDAIVFFEQPNHAAGEPWWANIVENKQMATDWGGRFDEYIEYCKEVTSW